MAHAKSNLWLKRNVGDTVYYIRQAYQAKDSINWLILLDYKSLNPLGQRLKRSSHPFKTSGRQGHSSPEEPMTEAILDLWNGFYPVNIKGFERTII